MKTASILLVLGIMLLSPSLAVQAESPETKPPEVLKGGLCLSAILIPIIFWICALIWKGLKDD